MYNFSVTSSDFDYITLTNQDTFLLWRYSYVHQ